MFHRSLCIVVHRRGIPFPSHKVVHDDLQFDTAQGMEDTFIVNKIDSFVDSSFATVASIKYLF